MDVLQPNNNSPSGCLPCGSTASTVHALPANSQVTLQEATQQCQGILHRPCVYHHTCCIMITQIPGNAFKGSTGKATSTMWYIMRHEFADIQMSISIFCSP